MVRTLPTWVADVIEAGTEDGPELESAVHVGRDAHTQLQEILPPELEDAARGMRTRSAGLREVLPKDP